MQIPEIKKTWIDAAVQASKLASTAIMEIYEAGFEIEYKEDRSPVTLADKTSSKIILAELAKTGIPVMSEEEAISPFEERRKNEFTWIVDPIDGTKEFIARNDEFCVCIALVHHSTPVFGLIASPVEQYILLGGNTIGAFYFNFETADYLSETYQVPNLKISNQKTVAYSRSHFSPRAQRIMDSLSAKYGELKFIKKGSALKFVDLVLGRADFYPRLAPTMEWDIAAGQAIYESVGGEVLDFTNFEPLNYNKKDLYNPFFIAKNKDLKI